MATEQEQPVEGESEAYQEWTKSEEEAERILKEMMAYIEQNRPGALDPEKVEIEALEKYGDAYETAMQKANELFKAWKHEVGLLVEGE